MKLALIMSGMLRNFHHTYYATKKFVLDDYFFKDKDIFFCGYSDGFNLEKSKIYFEELYSPKAMIIDRWTDEIKNEIESKTGCNKWAGIKNHPSKMTNVMSAWRCRYLANNLKINYEKENNFKYDLVYNLRCDMFFFNQIDHNLAILAKDDHNSVYIPKDWDFNDVSNSCIGDIMAFGSSLAMDKYYSIYEYSNSYREMGIEGHPETLLGNHFKLKKIIRKYCKRNLAREYPYTKGDKKKLWDGKWSKKEIYKYIDIQNNEGTKNEIKIKVIKKLWIIFKDTISLKKIFKIIKKILIKLKLISK